MYIPTIIPTYYVATLLVFFYTRVLTDAVIWSIGRYLNHYIRRRPKYIVYNQ